VEISARTLMVYVNHALASMGAALDRFDDGSVNAAPHGPGTNSAAALIVHACASSTYWLGHVGLGRPGERDRDAEFGVTATVEELRALLARTGEQLTELIIEVDAGPAVTDHELRVFLHDGDASDGSVVLHVFEELYQHLGHLELTADALHPPAPA